MYTFKSANKAGNIVHVHYRGIYLGRIMRMRKGHKNQPDRYVVVDRDMTTAIRGSRLWDSMNQPMLKETAAQLMKDYKRPATLKVV